MKWRIKRFIKSIKNLIRWFPVIWRDQDWDDSFIFDILKFKLKNQAEYIGKRGYHVRAERDAEIMMLCVRLIEKVQDEYYGMEYQDYHKSEFKFIDSKDYPGMYELDIVEKSEHFDDYFKKYPLVYKKIIKSNKKEIKNRTSIAFTIASTNHNRARKLLFKILEQNIERWWD